MLIVLIAYLGGVLTILSPCILPVLPFVFARADRPFRSHGLPLLVGMAVAYSVIATLAAFGGEWVIAVNEQGRHAALAVLALFGVTLMFPAVADRLSAPLVALGARLSGTSPGDAQERSGVLAPLVLGVGTGLLWAPCAGPILGLLLTTAALNGASVGTSALLFVYALGASTSLAIALLFGGRLIPLLKRTLPSGALIRRIAGAAVLVGVSSIALGADRGVLSRLSIGTSSALEQSLVEKIERKPASSNADAAVKVADASGAAAAREAPALRLPVEGTLPSFAGATEWINSAPLTPESLRGKVVLVDFWTYSCINCLRTLPSVRAWAEKYKDAGLVVVGVHTPEFAFEKLPANVRRATQDLHVGYPVAVDSNYAVWRAFDNHYWPAFYFIDAQGRVRYHQFGEDQYDRAEQVIRQLLAEAGQARLPAATAAPDGEGTQAAPGARPAQSQESYLGYQRAEGFASPGGVAPDRVHGYAGPSSLRLDQWALSGEWNVGAESVAVARPNARIAYRFRARDLHLVLGPSADGKPVRFKVSVDGQAPQADHGTDVDAQGNGVVDRYKLYQLVRQSGGDKERLFEIEFLDAGAQAYVFTFG